jgi:hypothetical protein
MLQRGSRFGTPVAAFVEQRGASLLAKRTRAMVQDECRPCNRQEPMMAPIELMALDARSIGPAPATSRLHREIALSAELVAASSLGFVALPVLYWPAVMAIIGCYTPY